MTSVSASHIILAPTQPVGSGETMTSVSAGHIILTPTQPVGSGAATAGIEPGTEIGRENVKKKGAEERSSKAFISHTSISFAILEQATPSIIT